MGPRVNATGDADDYRAVNHANWESRVPVHAASDSYALSRFEHDPARLSDVVSLDRERLGDLTGQEVVHLQCHIGTDTLSLARLGGTVTGLDFSQSALDVAEELAAKAGPPVDYVCADVYQAVEALGAARFDLVYTGVGALCWLPSAKRWAETVSGLLRPGGRLFLREGHPVLWALDDPRDDQLVVLEYPYFEGPGVPFSEDITYAGDGTPIASPDIVHFNHGLAEIFNALWDAGLVVDCFEEFDHVPWPALGDQMPEVSPGRNRLIDRPERLPASYILGAHKPSA